MDSRDRVQSSGTVLQLHQKHPVDVRRLKSHDHVLALPRRIVLRKSHRLDPDEVEGVSNVHERGLRCGEDQELFLRRIAEDLQGS